MKSKKLIAWIIAILVVVFPFRRAYLSDQPPGIMMMLSFILTLAGIVIFYFLTMNTSDKHHQS